MTRPFEEFQKTRETCADLGVRLQDEALLGCGGLIYCGSLYIEDTTTWPPTSPGHGRGRWATRIGRADFQSDVLERIEQVLYDFAVREGYFEA